MVLRTWVPDAESSGFGIHHLPYGAFVGPTGQPARLGVRIGEYVLDLHALADRLSDSQAEVATALRASNLNPFFELGPEAWNAVRERIQTFLSEESNAQTAALIPLNEIDMRAPFETADYVDFYASEHHATNVGKMFRPDGDPLMPNWKHLPVGYHGRSGTVVPSGTDVKRPNGQRRTPDGGIEFGPSKRLDIEAEMGFVVGRPSRLGTAVGVDDFTEHVFGMTLVNDWSARDIQAWEYQPLGPFLGKSFLTSYSAWITPLAALSEARTEAPQQDFEPLPYLREKDRFAYDVSLSVRLNDTTIAHPNFDAMYWTPAQQLAHMTVNGASLRAGDFFASGTISGPNQEQRGCLLELTWAGKEPVNLADGSTRTFLEDGDTVTIAAEAPGPEGSTLTLGEVTGTVTPAD
ncbi:fumarylacetoacetase [Haloglycomyces albus]|uniref:fumarylacetoacetase n=1 Tax=Haloglycomyces albus TaxID=526067 RepID=UPI00046C9C3F|nr:fumarylacetoacetase [Haloglycomyces albus]